MHSGSRLTKCDFDYTFFRLNVMILGFSKGGSINLFQKRGCAVLHTEFSFKIRLEILYARGGYFSTLEDEFNTDIRGI